MKISVILPCYNAGAYLSACLDSLLAQSMRDFEVIFVDDGSRDDSLALARRYAERDARIHVFSQENQGSARRATSALRMRGASGSRLWMATICCRRMRLKPCCPARWRMWIWWSVPMKRLTKPGGCGLSGRKPDGIAGRPRIKDARRRFG